MSEMLLECKFCKEPTKRESLGGALLTTMYYPPIYDEQGVNTNPDRNKKSENFKCLKCNNTYTVEGNNFDGYNYK